MSQIELVLRDFFHRHPDVRSARSHGLVNRRALARYILKSEGMQSSQLDAIIAALRRFDTGRPIEEKEFPKLLREITIATKENIVIITLKKLHSIFEKLPRVITCVDYNKSELLKISQGAASIKLFIDESNLKKVKEIFNEKDILDVTKNISEIGIIFPVDAIHTKGIIAYLASALSVEGINIVELMTCTPEMSMYVDEKQMLKAYETLWKIEESAKHQKK
jgi:aspartokinase